MIYTVSVKETTRFNYMVEADSIEEAIQKYIDEDTLDDFIDEDNSDEEITSVTLFEEDK